MGRAPCCDKANVKKGPWSPEEDAKLKDYIEKNGTGGNWIALPQKIGLKRCGKSCRLRWLNYLRPNIKHGGFSAEEDNMICSLYIKIGSRWSIIAANLPGRTDNDIKNYWNTKLKSRLLGKQRKQHRPRPRPRKNSRQQEANSVTQNLSMVNPEIAINQTPYNYLPQLSEATLVMQPACLDQSLDYAGTANHGIATADILMQELKGTRCHEDLSHKSSISTGIQLPIDATLMQEYGAMARNPSLSPMMQAVPVSSQIFMSSTVVTSDCNQIISSTWSDINYQQVPEMFPGLEDEVVFNENLQTLGEVDNYNYNNNSGIMESWLYYGSGSGNSCSSTDGESNISWEDMNSSFVVNNYPPMLADGSENCRGGFARGCTFEDQSRFLGRYHL